MKPLPKVSQPVGQFREDVPKRSRGDIKDILNRMVKPNKKLEERIESLEFTIWIVMATIFLLNIATSLIILKW